MQPSAISRVADIDVAGGHNLFASSFSSGWLVALMIAGLVAYLPALWGVFTFDDYSWILDNPGLQSSSFDFLQRRPVTLLTFAANLHFGGAHPVGFHIVNIALHLANGALLYAIIGRALPKTAAVAAVRTLSDACSALARGARESPVTRNINCVVNLAIGGYVEIFAENYQSPVNIDSFAGKSFFEVKQVR